MLLPSPSPYDDTTREALVEICNPLTLDTLALALAVWRAHRSLRGPLFSALHPLFQTFAEKLDKYADKLPEFVAMLGGQPVGTAEEIADGARLEPYPGDITDGLAHCREIVARAKALSGYIVEGIGKTNDLGAADALDLLTKLLEGIGYYGWQIGAHLDPTVAMSMQPKPKAQPEAQEPDEGPASVEPPSQPTAAT